MRLFATPVHLRLKKSAWLALAWLGLVVVATLIAEIFLPEVALHQRMDRMLESPNWSAPFGTDSLGRDLLARLLLGTKVSLSVGILGSFGAIVLGAVLGILAGWRGGWADRLVMRFTDILLSVPSFALVAVLSLGLNAALPLPPGWWRSVVSLVIALSLTHWMNIARVVRGLVMQAKVLPFIEAARALGAPDGHILLRHVVPHIGGTLTVLLGLQVPANILYESFMSFIGLGVEPPASSWGLLVQEGWQSLSSYPHLILFPALVLFLTVWSLHVLFSLRLSLSGDKA